MDKIINDYRKTVERLQTECTEKTDLIIKLEQENEKLKSENIQLKKHYNPLATMFKEDLVKEKCELKAENTRLKEEIKRIEYLQKDATCKKIDLLKDNLTYESALQEIRKIAEPRFVNGLNEESDLCNLAMDRIQTKINEVIGAE